MTHSFAYRRTLHVTLTTLACCWSFNVNAQSDPAPRDGDWTAPSFTFHTGQTLDGVRLHYLTIGDPSHPAVLVLHGTNQNARAMLSPAFAGKLFGPGQPLDARRYYIVIPDG